MPFRSPQPAQAAPPSGQCRSTLRHRRITSCFSRGAGSAGLVKKAEDLEPEARTRAHAAMPQRPAQPASLGLDRPPVPSQRAKADRGASPAAGPCSDQEEPQHPVVPAEQAMLRQGAAQQPVKPATVQTVAEPQVQVTEAAVARSALVLASGPSRGWVPTRCRDMGEPCTPRPTPAEARLARFPVPHMSQPSTAARPDLRQGGIGRRLRPMDSTVCRASSVTLRVVASFFRKSAAFSESNSVRSCAISRARRQPPP
jgi:hypothetical protein